MKRPVVVATALLLGLASGAADPVPGIVEPFSEARLAAPVAGTVETIVRREGETVKAGDVILKLDADLERLEVARRKLIRDSRAELEAAAARVATLREELAGTRKLFEGTQSVSREELRKRELELTIAEAEHAQLTSAEERERIEFEIAEQQLKRRSITAPFDGVVADIYLDPGEDCEPRQPLARLVQCGQCYFTGNLDTRVVRAPSPGRTVRLRLGDSEADAVTCTGRVSFVSPVIDPASGLRKFKVLFDNPGGRVTPGVAGVWIPEDEHDIRR